MSSTPEDVCAGRHHQLWEESWGAKNDMWATVPMRLSQKGGYQGKENKNKDILL